MGKKVKKRSFAAGTIFLVLISFGFFISGAVFLWAATLKVPDLTTFNDRVVLQSTKIYDRTGEVLLYDIHKDIQRTVIPFDKMSRHIKNATVAIEDTGFYEHKGIKLSAIFRAVLVNIGAGGFEQGGSTITQQVVKNSLLTPEKKIKRKLKEWVLALKLEQTTNKERILEMYLNEVPYGGNIYGVEEASKVFFNKSAEDLTLAESAYLAALPQAPTYYSPHGNNRGKLEERKNTILSRMYNLGFISEKEYEEAKNKEVIFLPRSEQGILAPHFVFYVREQLEQMFGKDAVERGGLDVVTTLDYNLQEKAEKVVFKYVTENTEKFNAHNAGLTAVEPSTGNILVMVGSKDYFGTPLPESCTPGVNCAFDPQVNITTRFRQPGSAFKPFVYATAFMKGYTPETVVFDLETQFHSGCDPYGKPLQKGVREEDCYTPSNYDNIFRGPVTLREALAQSINIPAIKVLYLAGVRDSLETAEAMGISSLTNPGRYGLTLVLGGGEVSLLEMASAYGVFAHDGIRNKPTSILEVRDSAGKILFKRELSPKRVLPKSVALQISDVLSDNDARAPAFGQNSYLHFPNYDVAVKTGTTNDYRDAWIVGYTQNISVGAWAGNNDNSPMDKKVAGFIIAPLWNAFLEEALAALPQDKFQKPAKQNTDSLAKPVLRGVWKGNESYFIDTISGKRATEFTPEETKEERFITNIHSILYWVNKHDPLKEKPLFPNRDPQFELWEHAVRRWVEDQNIREGGGPPTEEDPIHKPEFFPTLTLHDFDENKLYNQTDVVRISVSGKGEFGVTKIDLYINNIYIGSDTSEPFIFSFSPQDIENIQKENKVRIVGYDSVFNKNEILTSLKTNFE